MKRHSQRIEILMTGSEPFLHVQHRMQKVWGNMRCKSAKESSFRAARVSACGLGQSTSCTSGAGKRGVGNDLIRQVWQCRFGVVLADSQSCRNLGEVTLKFYHGRQSSKVIAMDRLCVQCRSALDVS